MKEVKTQFKEKTIAVDFDGVIHKYSKGFQGLDNVYDPPMPGAFEALTELKDMGYRLIIVSSRPVEPIRDWLKKEGMLDFFDDVTNTKHPARFYIDDHAIRFEKSSPSNWKDTLNFIKEHEDK
jgi:ribonucleotide monophosphatase NagD (HAD superfamily)